MESMAAQNDLPEVQLDLKALYREDVFTDRRAGSIRRLTPVTADGSVDPTRPVLFSGQTQLLTPAGVLPPGVEIEAATPIGKAHRWNPVTVQTLMPPSA